jgi:hypothetical protein
MLGHGLAVFNDEKGEFERVKTLDLKDRDRFPGQAHPIRREEAGIEYIYSGEVFPNVRVRARWKDYFDPESYEAYSVVEEPGPGGEPRLARDAQGRPRYAWQRGAKPTDGAAERRLIAAGRMKAEEARFLPLDADSGKPVLMHRGSVRWNAHRNRWIMIAGQSGGTSNLGEIWYAEAAESTGPWRRAKKIVTHDRYSFYNPVHHSLFDQEGGRLIFFEGTYTHTFSGHPAPTPRYDYNQIMYRLDLGDPRLRAVQEKRP